MDDTKVNDKLDKRWQEWTDIRAFIEWICAEQYDQLLRIVTRYTGTTDLAYEVVHALFIRAMEKADAGQLSSINYGWFLKAVEFAAQNEMERFYHTDLLIGEESFFEKLRGAAPDEEPLDHVLPHSLKEDDKEFLRLRFESQWTYAKLANHYGCTEAACRQRMSRLLKKIAPTFDPDMEGKKTKSKKRKK